ncbi:MAG: VPS10 domain-containing protein [Lutibacter sp.]
MKKYTLFLLAFSTILFGQNFDVKKFKAIKTRAIGPAGMSGRITAIDAVINNPDIIYVGSASGGVWKSESGGVDWKPVFDKYGPMSIGAIAVEQNNPDVVWVGTGEGNPRNSVSGGYGIYKSLDAGKTFKLMGLEKTRNIHRIIIDKNNPNIVYVGAIGSSWGTHKERGVFKTTDGGKTWKNILFTNEKSGCADLVVDPKNPNKLIAGMWQHQRKPWTFNSGGPGSGLYLTYDGGEHWKKITSKEGLPDGILGRIGLSFATNKPEIVYALIEAKKNALYKSEDGGEHWKKINDKSSGKGKGGIGDRPFYYSDIFVSPNNENRIYTIFTYVNVSEDGGKTFKRLMPTYGSNKGVHPDHHAWWINPKDPLFMMDGNDGGLNITHDGGKTWRFVENLPVGQFYHINVDNDFPYHVYGGMQDNGSWRGPAYVLKAQGIRNSYWQELMFGDGFDVVPNISNSKLGFAMSQQGYVGRYDISTGSIKIIRPTHPNPDLKLRFNWNAAIALSPIDHKTLYFGSQFVHQSTDNGYTWKIISPDLTTNNKEQQKQFESGGLTMDTTGAENHCTILAIEPSSLNKNLIWVGTDDGQIQLTKNGGTTWSNITKNIKNFPQGAWIPQIRASKFNEGEAYIVVNNYRQFDFKSYLYRTRDYGKTWENLLKNKPETFGYALSIIQDIKNKKLLFLGTEYGLYISIDEGKNWTKWTHNYPTVSTKDLTIQPNEQDLVIGSFGRSIYVLDDIRPFRALANEGPNLLNKTLYVFNPPTAHITINQQPTGTRFGANALFNGDNRKEGAMISYLINRPEQNTKSSEKSDKKEKLKEKPTVKFDSLFIQIFNDKNELVRSINKKAPKENGVHRFYWHFEENGKRGPSRKLFKKNKNKPSGIKALPGSYLVKIHFGNETVTTPLTVKYDPRVKIDLATLSNIHQLAKQLEDKKGIASSAIQQLLKSKAIVKNYQKQLKDLNSKNRYKEAIDKQTAMLKEINRLIDAMLGKEDKRQGITAQEFPSPISYLYNAQYYVQSLEQKPGSTEFTLIENANKKVGAVIKQINEFYKTKWPAYENEMINLKLVPFEKTKFFKF